MLWAMGAIFLHFQALPQAVVPAISNTAAEAVSLQQATTEAADVTLADVSSADDTTSFEPGRLMLTPVAGPAVASPLASASAVAVKTERNPQFAGRTSNGQKRLWLGLAVAQHGAATFDAWSTRRAISRGAQELNPMLKPFASNGSIYAAAQAGPALLDLLGRRMMTSRNHLLRRTWWLPQVLGTVASLAAGAHNLRAH